MADRTLDSQRIIHEMAGLLSTFGHHARHRPEECIPEAEALYDAFFTEQSQKVKAWMETAAQEFRNCHYYRNLLYVIAAELGPSVYLADDSTVSDDVLCAKLPALVREQVHKIERLRAVLTYVPEEILCLFVPDHVRVAAHRKETI